MRRRRRDAHRPERSRRTRARFSKRRRDAVIAAFEQDLETSSSAAALTGALRRGSARGPGAIRRSGRAAPPTNLSSPACCRASPAGWRCGRVVFPCSPAPGTFYRRGGCLHAHLVDEARRVAGAHLAAGLAALAVADVRLRWARVMPTYIRRRSSSILSSSMELWWAAGPPRPTRNTCLNSRPLEACRWRAGPGRARRRPCRAW